MHAPADGLWLSTIMFRRWPLKTAPKLTLQPVRSGAASKIFSYSGVVELLISFEPFLIWLSNELRTAVKKMPELGVVAVVNVEPNLLTSCRSWKAAYIAATFSMLPE